jgi:predicted MFS family arabinose efflux permease
VLVSLAASVVLLVSFVLIERRSSRPLLPMRLLADRSRSGAYLIMLCIATGLFGVFFFLTLFIQNVLGYSAIRAGIAFLPFAVGVVIASALASQLVARVGARPRSWVAPDRRSAFVAWGVRAGPDPFPGKGCSVR